MPEEDAGRPVTVRADPRRTSRSRRSPSTRRRAASVRMGAVSEAVPRTFFRAIRSQYPSWADFLSNLVRDQPPRRIELADPLEWAGVSAFDSLAEARARARSFPVLGR